MKKKSKKMEKWKDGRLETLWANTDQHSIISVFKIIIKTLIFGTAQKTILNTACLIFLSLANFASAQDFHLSQYDAVIQYMNPAMTGMYQYEKGDYRISSDYRSQWKSLGVRPYSTAYLAYDMPFKKWEKNFGLGAYLINNRSGVGHFNTLNFMVSAAYDVMNKSDGKHYLTTGLQLGILNKSFNPSTFTYDIQYSFAAGGFDQTIANGEAFDKTNILRFDANYGIYYKYIEKGKKAHPFAGFSIQHVTRPNESFTGAKSKLPMRFNFQTGCDVQVNEKLKLVPRFLYMNQARANEINIGLLAYYRVKDKEPEVSFGNAIGTVKNEGGVDALLGLDYRHKDAVIIHAGIKIDRHIFRFSYDINTSYLNRFSGGRGAWEFSLILVGEKGKSLLPQKSMF